MTLYQQTSEMLDLLARIEAGEIPEEAIADTLEAVESDWRERVDAVISAIKNITAEADAIDEETCHLANRAGAKRKTVERLKKYLTDSMQAVGAPAYESPRHLVTFRKSTRTVVTDSVALLEWARENAPETIKQSPEYVSISAIKDKLAELDVPGVSRVTAANIQIK